MSAGLRRALRIASGFFLVSGLIALLGVVLLTRTDFGRERIRGLVESQLNDRLAGRVTFGRLSGDPLSSIALAEVRIDDADGRRVLSADTVALRYSLRSLLSRRLVITDVRLVQPVAELDRGPNGWNVARLIPHDTTGSTATGGALSTVRLEDIEVRDGTFVIRTVWTPPDSLPADAVPARVEAARQAGDWIVARGDGYLRIAVLADVRATLPYVRIADPDSAGLALAVDTAHLVAFPFRTRAATVTDLHGSVGLQDGTVHARDVRIALPRSELLGKGAYDTESGALDATIEARRVAFEDFRWALDRLPRGDGSGRFRVARADSILDVHAETFEVDLDDGTAAGTFDVRIAGAPTLTVADVTFADVDTRTLESVAERALPIDGALTGQLHARGASDDLTLDGEVNVQERSGRVSSVRVHGTVGAATDGLEAQALRLDFSPLQVSLVRQVAPDLALDGRITGDATVSGSSATGFRARFDVAHAASTGRSVLRGTAETGRGGAFDLDATLPTVSLATVGTFAPAAGLRGEASGTLHATGTGRRIAFETELAFADRGSVRAVGTFENGAVPSYDVRAVLQRVDFASIVERAPATRVTGVVDARGRGTDAARLEGSFAADLRDSRVADYVADSVRLRTTVANGIATVVEAHVRVANSTADADGTLALIDGGSSALRYRIAVASLADFAAYLPADTGVVTPRPLVQAALLAKARADSARIADSTQVQRLATGNPPLPELQVDTVRAIPRDSVAGRVVSEGVVGGFPGRLTVNGDARAEGVIAAGAAFANGRARYALGDLGAPDPDVRVDVALDSVRAAGFAFDSASAELRYRGRRDAGRGSLALAIVQDPDRDYRLSSEYLVELDRKTLTFDDVVMRFDSSTWTSPHRGHVSWAGSGVTIDSLELRNGERTVALDGHVATDAESDVRVVVRDLPLGQIAGLLQDTVLATGDLTLEARLTGTAAAPSITGSSALRGATLRGTGIPDVEATFDYARAELQTDVTLRNARRALLDAHARLPVDLALTGVEGPRLREAPLSIDARADSLPLDGLPVPGGAIESLRGSLRGDLRVAGTWRAPVLDGTVVLDSTSMHITSAGVDVHDIEGTLRFEGNALTVDSLVAWTDGPARVSGSIDFEELARPTFNLLVLADRTVLFDTNQGTVLADAQVAVTGPLDSARVQGSVNVREGVIELPDMGERRRVTPLDDASLHALGDSTAIDVEIPRSNPFLERLRLDVALRVGRNTWVRNSDANVEIYTPADGVPLHVRMNEAREGLELEGTINADRGEYEFAGRVFDLTTGSVTFLPGQAADPLLQLTAAYEVPRRGRESLVIQVHLTGTLSEPRVALESSAEPPLSESDMLSYLAFGRSSSSVLGLDGGGLAAGESAGDVGALAEQQLASLALGTAIDDAVANIERKGGNAFDVFRIHPAQLPDELALADGFGNFLRSTEIEAGKYIAGDFFVSTNVRANTDAWPGFGIEYETAGGFSWRAVWESRYLPNEPTFVLDQPARSTRVLGTFLSWRKRF